MKYIRDENNNKIILFHGTNRKFKEHSLNKARTVLNEKYQKDWICYSPDEKVAWAYADAARNQNLDKEIFLKETEIIFNEIDKEFTPEIMKLFNNIYNNGYENGWDVFLEKKDEIKIRIAKLNRIKEKLSEKYNDNLDIDDYLNCLDIVEGSKSSYENIDEKEMLLNMLNGKVTEISPFTYQKLKKMGYNETIPEPKVVVSYIKANNVVKTDNKELARECFDNQNVDLVIYNGEGIVNGVEEYLIKNPEQIEIKELKIRKYEFDEDDDSYRIKIETQKQKISNSKKIKYTI